MTAVSDETGRDWLPLKYEDGPDFCTVTFATGAAFALTVHPERMKLMEAALSAAPVAQEPVAIKLLEWRDRGPAVHPQWEAVSVVGSYFIATIKGGQFNWWTTALRGKIEQHSLNDAKDAAQADYEKRIRSALSNPPATPAGVGADEIARAVCDGMSNGNIQLDEAGPTLRADCFETATAILALLSRA